MDLWEFAVEFLGQSFCVLAFEMFGPLPSAPVHQRLPLDDVTGCPHSLAINPETTAFHWVFTRDSSARESSALPNTPGRGQPVPVSDRFSGRDKLSPPRLPL